jgi:hypothetical protein
LPARKNDISSAVTDVAHQRVHLGQELHVVDADASDGGGPELGFHHRREPDVARGSEEFVQ